MSVAGRWTSNQAPYINDGDLGFDDNAATVGVGKPQDWTVRTARVGNARATFTRTVGDDGVVSITSDCDDPTMLLLARKGDPRYWNGDIWRKDHKTRRTWSADITVEMLRDGLVSTVDTVTGDGPQTAMTAVGDHRALPVDGPHFLTGVVAQIRGVRLVQSMAPADGQKTTLGNYQIPRDVPKLLQTRLWDVFSVYDRLFQPPWTDTNPPGVPWGFQVVAGAATNRDGRSVFIGEHSDLVWRALTETDHYGRSPLKTGLIELAIAPGVERMVVAAVLYDNTAERQLTTGLFDGVPSDDHQYLVTKTRKIFVAAMNPYTGQCRWNTEQQDRIGGFIDTLDGIAATTVRAAGVGGGSPSRANLK